MNHPHILIELTVVEMAAGGGGIVIAHPGAEVGDIVWVSGTAKWGVLQEVHDASVCTWTVQMLSTENLAEALKKRLHHTGSGGLGEEMFMPVLGAATKTINK